MFSKGFGALIYLMLEIQEAVRVFGIHIGTGENEIGGCAVVGDRNIVDLRDA